MWQTVSAGSEAMTEHAMRTRFSGVMFVVAALAGGACSAHAQQGQPAGNSDDPNQVIASLRRVADDLNGAVKSFQTDLDREIAAHDQGSRTQSGRKIPGADVDLSGPADAVQTATRKLFAARMISARRKGYAPAAVADANQIQRLIVEARNRIKVGNDLMRRLLVVSVKGLQATTYAEQRKARDELLRARNAASEAAKRAYIALPVVVPEADSPEEQRERAWDLVMAKLDVPRSGTPQEKPARDPVFLPIAFEEGKKVVLINEHCCGIALTDSGLEDRHGRRLFYQEEWVRRTGNPARTATGAAGIVIMQRWAVAVDTVTGQHTLLRRYKAHEFGEIGDLYQSQGSEYLSRVNLPEEETKPPSIQELQAALTAMEHSREELRNAIQDFNRQIREAVARNDALLAADDKPALDSELQNALREKLFAIRGHLSGTTAILDSEAKVRRAVEVSAARIRVLEGLAAWVGGNVLDREGPADDSPALLEALSQSDAGIDLTRSLEQTALAALPPEVSSPEAAFPALDKNMIVRIRRLSKSPVGLATDPVALAKEKCRQEIWLLTGPVRGTRQVTRAIVFIDVETKSGNQIPTGKEVRSYPFGTDDTLEGIYDENAAQP
jgi:hypothetical protein